VLPLGASWTARGATMAPASRCRGVLVRVPDGKIGGLTQQHDGKAYSSGRVNDQEIRGGAHSRDGHDAETTGFSRPGVAAHRAG